DGIHSQVRTQLFGPISEEAMGYAAFRSVVPMEEVPAELAPNSVLCWCGPGYHLVHYPLRGGTLFNMVAVVSYSRADEEAGRLPERLQEAFAGACAPMQTLVKHIDLSRHWPIKDITPLSSWARGRVCLIGDAAHAKVQAMAQGACQAIEDGVKLAECVERYDGDYIQAFDALVKERLLRTTRVHHMSRYMWEVIHVRSPLTELRRDMLGQLSEAEWVESLSWLYEKPDGASGGKPYAPVMEGGLGGATAGVV
ncbi:FAD-dependent monooxygenase, partial [Halomonas sp. 25-S5]|uniref:FAD-dependent monooxygenase n=1 Tax=Halomonas sp. 25-S5 TaxID=2994065 RepID=UPI0024699752